MSTTTFAPGTRIRIDEPLLRDLHGLTGTIIEPTVSFDGNGWRDVYTVTPDKPLFYGELQTVSPNHMAALSGDDPQDEDDEWECNDECCRGPYIDDEDGE